MAGTEGQQRIASGEPRAARLGIEIDEQPLHFPPQFGIGRGGRTVSAKGKRPPERQERQATESRVLGEAVTVVTSSKIRGIGTTGLFSVYARWRRAETPTAACRAARRCKSYVLMAVS